MTNFAEILGDKVRFYDRVLIDEKELSDVLSDLHTGAENSYVTQRLPKECVFIATAKKHTAYVVERPPRLVTVRYGYGLERELDGLPGLRREDEAMVAIVPVPWEYYVMSFSDEPQDDGWGTPHFRNSTLSILWSPEQVLDVDQNIWPANLPNTGNAGNVCLGGTTVDEDSPAKVIHRLANEFYDSNFNSDMGGASGPFDCVEDWLNADIEHIEEWPWLDPAPGTMRMALAASGFTTLANLDDKVLQGSPKAFLLGILDALPPSAADRLAGILTGPVTDE